MVAHLAKSLVFLLSFVSVSVFAQATLEARKISNASKNSTRILILGGGVAGVIAARTLHERGYDNFLLVEARDELGGRMQTQTIGGNWTIERGPNWVQGTQTGDGPKNPIFALSEKHNVSTVYNDLTGSVSFFDYDGPANYSETFDDADDLFVDMTILAGARVQERQIDLTARAGYSLIGSKPKSHTAQTAEYYMFDWEYSQTPEESSWLASSLNNNYTFDTDMGGFSEDNLLCIDQRGFKTLIQAEAAEFLQSSQHRFNSTVSNIEYSKNGGVQVTLTSNETIQGDYALVTFSVGVLQNDDVSFDPELPDWKQEAIQAIAMTVYTKIFLKFSENFWFDTQMALYADKERGKYPIWQSLDTVGFLPGSGILFVTVTGDYSKRIEALPDSQVQSEVLDILGLMYPNITIPDPTDFYFPRWHSDPLFRGSYSNMPSGYEPAHQKNLRATVEDVLWFAGEASSEKYYGFLHGAYFEGLNVTNKLADCLDAGGCEDGGLAHIAAITKAYE